jgi:hypothetical protein
MLWYRRNIGVAPIFLAALMLISFGISTAAASTGLEIILDASGSMNEEFFYGTTKIEGARTHLASILGHIFGEDLDIGLRVFGWDIPDCSSELVVDLGSSFDSYRIYSMKEVARTIFADQNTPLAEALHYAGLDLRPYEVRRILLITDGNETCGGDPAEVVRQELKGYDVVIYAVNYGGGVASKELQEAVDESGGKLYNAETPGNLAKAIGEAVSEALSSLRGWIKLHNTSEEAMWLYVNDRYEADIPAGSSLTFPSYPGISTVVAVPYNNWRMGIWRCDVTVCSDETVEAFIHFEKH